ncbi:MAG: amidohydrolase family protein [Haliea sp.]|uniref:N-acyl-D-amino-acid deacylase family protein n=1 Tax=Haliea sp. TaxID=1932666 RepID=UPI0032F00C07
MSHDLVIRNGTVVDGTGAARKNADIAIDGDRITKVGEVSGKGIREIDASNKIVTPGFIDIHTHLDAQIAWDPFGSSCCYHGITSAVLGNCGVTFAPCKPEDRDYLANMMESVEDIPAAVIRQGVPFNWETYGEYLQAIDKMDKGINFGGMVGHCAVRYYAMGERSLGQEPATAGDIEKITALVDEAIASGALGFSTSRTYMHKVPDGRYVPGTYADTEELLAIGRVLGKHEKGVFGAAPRFGERDHEAHLPKSRAEIDWMSEISRENDVKVTFGLGHTYRRPDLYRQIIDFVEKENTKGAVLRPQATTRGIGDLFGIHHRTPFANSKAWLELSKLPFEQRVAALENEKMRAQLANPEEPIMVDVDMSFVLTDENVDYTFNPDNTLAAHAKRMGVTPVEAFIELNRQHKGRVVVWYPEYNQSIEALRYMLKNPTVAIGLGDAGAHVGQVMDASGPTWLLSYWVRDTGEVELEDAIRGLTSDAADLFGIKDRGVIREGAFADINVIDLDALASDLPEYKHDFPGGAGRYVQTASGYDHVIVNGQCFLEAGEHTGAFAGVTLRS